MVLCLALVPLVSTGSFTLGRYTTAILLMVAALGLNLALGYAGQLVLGHVVIMAVAAYSAAMISVFAELAFVPSLLAGVVIGTIFGTLMMSVGIRVGGWYLALVTLFSVLVLPHAAQLFPEWSGGEFGVTGMASPTLFGYPLGSVGMYLVVVAGFAAVWFASANLINSAWGLRFRALRDAPRAAESVGIDLVSTRLYVYIVSSVPPALAGTLLAFSERFVHYDSFNIGLTLLLLTGVVLGGAGTKWGTIAGMLPLLVLSFWVGPFSPYNAIGLGVGLLVGALIFTNGLVPALLPLMPSAGRKDGIPTTDANPAPLAASMAEAAADPAARDEAVVELTKVEKRFGGNHVLKGLNLSVRRGSLLGVVGPNGSGKSTLLNTLSGFVKPDSGTIKLKGMDIAGWPIHRRAAMGLGRTFQVPQLIDELGPLENIAVGLVARERATYLAPFFQTPGVRKANAERHQASFATFAELRLPNDLLDLTAAKIPLGLKRIVEVGRAIVSRPDVLLLDEPTAGLDDSERAEFGQLLRYLQGAGMTVVVVEHNVPFVLEYCDELVLLESGEITVHADMSKPLPARLRSYLSYAPEHHPGADQASLTQEAQDAS
ncbi:ATP-binding cassette domain-containing protein [Aquibium sp. LZ166]|uniref:ATP-binding cassette domain-containing protein n=1 Tax=Aquibium pacificus TaxID=3153579 RepID=A0ABV3SKJ1_9HYPH